jgi:ABC-type uncharacterized transport system permease subunit
MGRNKKISDFIVSVYAIIFSFFVTAFFILIMGESPIEAYQALFQGAFGSVQAIANTLSKSIPLVFTGLAVGFALKGGLLNIGAEGQLYIGAFASVLIALLLPDVPGLILLPLAIVGGFIGGMAWGGMVGVIKAKFGVNEVIVTIMTNYIAVLFTSYMVNGPFKAEGMVPQTEIIPPGANLIKLIPRTQLTAALFMAVAAAYLVYWFLYKTTWGYEIRAVGENPTAAQAGGINTARNMILTMALSGGIAALAGITEVLGKYGRFIDGFSPSFGFTGIAVAVLGKISPVGTLITALLFGALDAGAMRMNRTAGISANMVVVIQGLVILFIAAPEIARSLFVKRGKN